MALLFMDGFDHYATADITKKWNSISGTVTINAAAGRRGGGALATGTSSIVKKTITASSTLIIGFAYYLIANPASSRTLCSLYDGASAQCELRLNSNGTLYVTRAGVSLTDGQSVSSISVGTYNYIEWKVTISNSIAADSCIVRVNGGVWINVAAGQDLQATGNASASTLELGNQSGTLTSYFDDFYVCNSSGTANNDFLGDVRIDTLYPTSDGNYAQLTPSTGVNHYALVDETPANTTDYNSGSSVGLKDTYGLANLASTPSGVFGLQVNVAAAKNDAGLRGVKPLLRSGATDSLGAELMLSTSQLYATTLFETDPNTAAAWTESGVNALEAGAQIST